MFIKVKVINECDDGDIIRNATEKIVNTDFIATVEQYSRPSRRAFEVSHVAVCKIKLITGEEFEVIGSAQLENGHIHIDGR